MAMRRCGPGQCGRSMDRRLPPDKARSLFALFVLARRPLPLRQAHILLVVRFELRISCAHARVDRVDPRRPLRQPQGKGGNGGARPRRPYGRNFSVKS